MIVYRKPLYHCAQPTNSDTKNTDFKLKHDSLQEKT